MTVKTATPDGATPTEPVTETTVEGAATTPATEESTPSTDSTAATAAQPAPVAETPAEQENPPKADDETLSEGGRKALEAEREAKKELERQLAELKNTAVKKEDFDAAVAERDELKAQLQRRDAQEALLTAAEKAGARNPKAVVRLADASAFDAEKKNAADLIKAVQDEFPEQFGTAPQPGLGTTDAPGKQRAFYTQEEVERMSDSEYVANREHILASSATWA
jgi:hypothetical protein